MALIKKGAKAGKKGKLGGKALKRKAPVEEPEIELSDEDFDFDQESDVEEEKKVVFKEDDEEEDDEGHDSDKELQIALRDGLLKTDRLNYVVERKRPVINKTAEIREKIAEFSKKLPWIETLDVVTQSTLTKDMINNDFEREMQFYKQAEKAVQIAVPKLLNMGVKVLRPADYYAEMSKSDGHMQKVRQRLLKIQEGKERQEAIRRMREEKKFATKVQRQVIDNKNAEKKKLMEAVKKHKKGMKQQLEDMLNNVKRYNLDREDDQPARGPSGGNRGSFRGSNNRGSFGGPNNRSKNFKAQFKSEKFGYGGKKKGLKRNNKESFDDVFSKPGGRGGRVGGGGGRGGFGGRGRGGSGGRGRGGRGGRR